jgi:hypothetical protein
MQAAWALMKNEKNRLAASVAAAPIFVVHGGCGADLAADSGKD